MHKGPVVMDWSCDTGDESITMLGPFAGDGFSLKRR